MTPTEFVLARTADREREASAALRDVIGAEGKTYGSWGAFGNAVMANAPDQYVWVVMQDPSIGSDTAVAAHIALNDPAAVLARCAVDRRILEEHETIRARYAGSTIEDDPCCKTCSGYGDDPGEYPCATVALLASLDADHPDYDSSWWPL